MSAPRTQRGPVASAKRVFHAGLRRWYASRLRARREPLSHLFILGHMRCGSTLLTNILCSHPEVIGFGETRTVYEDEHAFTKLVWKVHWAHRRFRVTRTYALDKLLHNHQLPDPTLLDQRPHKLIFLSREPVRTIRSTMVQLGYTEEQALEYYAARLDRLTAIARTRQEHSASVWTTYERMVEDPDHVLREITAFLNLETPLSKEYTRPPRSDKKGVGDSKGQISAGEIVPQRKLDVEVSERVQRQAITAHDTFCEAMRGLVREL